MKKVPLRPLKNFYGLVFQAFLKASENPLEKYKKVITWQLPCYDFFFSFLIAFQYCSDALS